ncbi:hypothetical protein KBZ07_13630 [Cyanobium sp. BA20m-14]|uniref:hypothetical protein n=1 Tax=Cyanobium sp. BA20m-14 TaxID=2823703 RepID=UPI0020CBED9A|nr:hypothetical protein [Cyanobium sp. BA20m-14]MCP9914424.1 hypothetical protein [Cyanobium sp. BA20m-14]
MGCEVRRLRLPRGHCHGFRDVQLRGDDRPRANLVLVFRDQKSRVYQLESSGLRVPDRINRLLLLVAIAVLVSSLQGFAVSLAWIPSHCRS